MPSRTRSPELLETLKRHVSDSAKKSAKKNPGVPIQDLQKVALENLRPSHVYDTRYRNWFQRAKFLSSPPPPTEDVNAFDPGAVLIGCIQAVHERPDLYPDPLRFDPNRFLDRSYGPGEFLPFGGGARRCLGAALAVYEMKLILASLLQHLSLSLTPAADRCTCV